MATPIKISFTSDTILPTLEALEKQFNANFDLIKEWFPVGASLKGQFTYTLPVTLADKSIDTVSIEIDAS
jgi:hypothetical protein